MRYNRMSMKTITIRQPWAAFVVAGEITIGNRSCPTKHHTTILIHAAKKYDTEAMDAILREPEVPGEHYDPARRQRVEYALPTLVESMRRMGVL